MTRSSLLSSSAAMAAVMLLAACGGGTEEAAEPPPPAVEAAAVRAAGGLDRVTATGTLQRQREAQLSFRVPGVITQLSVEEGDLVRKGQLIARIDPTAVEAGRQQALASLEQARRNYARDQTLFEQGFVSRQRLDDRKSALEAAEAVVTAITEAGGKAQAVQADVSQEADVLAMFFQIGSEPLDILVNNAGIAHSSPIESLEVNDFDRLMGVHLRGTFLCTRSALKIMYAQNSGRIINTASQLAYIGAPGFSHYTAAKGAILSFTRSLALEIGDRPITANCVAPGATMTPILADVPDDILEGIRQNIPAGRIAEVEDIVGAYLFLASDAAGHFRGQCLSPNGGDAFF